MAIITDRHVEIYQTIVSDLRESLGRVATIYLQPTQTDCAWCIYDPIHKRSSGLEASGYVWSTHPDYVSPLNDKVCPNCGGKGFTYTDNTVTVKGTKKELNYSDEEVINIGVFKPGTIRFACDLDDVLVTEGDRDGETYFDRAILVIYEGVRYKVMNISKSGLRDLYTCRVILERTNE